MTSLKSILFRRKVSRFSCRWAPYVKKSDFQAEYRFDSAWNHKSFCEERILHGCSDCQFDMLVGQSALHIQEIRLHHELLQIHFNCCSTNDSTPYYYSRQRKFSFFTLNIHIWFTLNIILATSLTKFNSIIFFFLIIAIYMSPFKVKLF